MFQYIIILTVKSGVLLPTNLLFKVDKHLTDSPRQYPGLIPLDADLVWGRFVFQFCIILTLAPRWAIKCLMTSLKLLGVKQTTDAAKFNHQVLHRKGPI